MCNAKELLCSAIVALTMTGLSAMPAAGNGADYYVDAAVDESGDGTEWAEAFKTLQEVLDVALPDQIIWVADRIYVPSEEYPEGDPDPRTKTFELINRVKIYGGFQGNDHPEGGEDALEQRDPVANVAELEGELSVGEQGPNQVYHVVSSYLAVTPETIFSGFHVQDGRADELSGPRSKGGGMYVFRSSPTVTRCTFRRNFAQWLGSGVFVRQDSSGDPGNVLNCTFHSNGGEQGSGMAATAYYAPEEPMLVVNCLFTGNAADTVGGAYMGYGHSHTTLVNCTLADNSANLFGGGVYLDDSWIDPKITLRNCILWGNTDMHGQDESAQISGPAGMIPGPEDADVAYTCIQGLDVFGQPPHHDNIGDDPVFAGEDNYRLCTGSPCIDAGNTDDVPADVFDVDDDLDFSEAMPDRDMKGRLMPDEETGPVDMGAYEFRCYADFDGDCDVDTADLLFLLAAWGTPDGDVDGDGDTDTADLLLLLGAWGSCSDPGSGQIPQTVQDCIDKFGFGEPEALAACIEAVTGGFE
jgi:hypothetical protein